MFRSSFALLFLIAATVSLCAQDSAAPKIPAPPSRPLPSDAARPPVPAPTPFERVTAVNAPSPLATPSPTPITLQYPNSDVADVLHLYEQLTGKRLVIDNFVQGKVNIFIAKPVSHDDAVQIIEMNLLLNGYSLVPAENNIVKVIGTGRNPRAAGVPIISEQEDIPSGDHVISYLFKLHYADPVELQQVLGQYLSPPQPYTSFLALAKSSSILVTENSSVIRGLAHVIEQIDVPPAEVKSEFIKLERADASKVVEMLNVIFEKGTLPNGQPLPGGRGIRPVASIPSQPNAGVPPPENEPGALATLSEDSVVVGKIKLSADVRTNRIHVITRPINLPFVRRLIGEFDANVEFAKPVTRPLKFISAGEVLPVLVTALTEPGSNEQGGANAPNNTLNPQQGQGQTQRRAGNSNINNSSGGTSSGEGLNVSEELETQATDTTPKAVTIGNSKIIADPRANSIIILGNREVVAKVFKILDQMDVRSPQVALSTVIGELTLNNDQEFGIDYFLQFKNKGIHGGDQPIGVGGVSRNTGASILDPASLITFPNLAAAATGGGSNLYLSGVNTLSGIVHLLDSTGNFHVISRPMVFTSNNKKAIIASGREIPVPVSTISSSTGGGIVNTGLAQQSNIQFKKVALQLEVVPLINSEKEVSLDILQKLDSVAGSTTVDGNQIPNISTRYIRTNVSAPNRSTIVLGGLITDNKRRSAGGIPVLSHLPLVGGLFRETVKNKERQELIVLMRPEVTNTRLDLYKLRESTKAKLHFGNELDENEPKPVDYKELPPPDLPPAK